VEQRWTDVDHYLTEVLVGADPALSAALEASEAAGLPAIQVSPPQGKLLHLLARAIGARRILEIGTLGGYSGIWLARALPEGGRLVTLEIEPKHAEVAQANFERAGVADRVEIRQGPALETLPQLEGPFDLVFIDADKPSNPDYFEWGLRLARVGSFIIVDNIVRSGAVLDGQGGDPTITGVRRVNELIAAEPRVVATALQMVGVKGWDGFALALVVA
jgi:predicted O-methyltransferase YrrM